MFSLVKNYKKLFLMCVRNEFDEAGAGDKFLVHEKIQELKNLGIDGIEENEEKSVKDILADIKKFIEFNKNTYNGEQLDEIINFLKIQKEKAEEKERGLNEVSPGKLEDEDFLDLDNYKVSDFLGQKITEFENLKKNYETEKNGVQEEVKKSTKEAETNFFGNKILGTYTDKNGVKQNILLKNISSPGANGIPGKIRYEVELDNSGFIDKGIKFDHKPDNTEIKEAIKILLKEYNNKNFPELNNKAKNTEKVIPIEKVSVEVEERESEENYGFIIEKDGSVILPDGIEPSDENNIFINPKTQEKYKLENGKIIKIGEEENSKEKFNKFGNELQKIFKNLDKSDFQKIDKAVDEMVKIMDSLFSGISDEDLKNILDEIDNTKENEFNRIIEDNRSIFNNKQRIEDFRIIFYGGVEKFKQIISDKRVSKEELYSMLENSIEELKKFSKKYGLDKNVLEKKFFNVDNNKEKSNSGEKTSSTVKESKEKVNYSLEEAKKFYEKVGATKENIKEIQEKLDFKGEKIDGVFGPQTFKAIKEYQKKNGLTPDGKVGNKTLKKLISEDMTVDKFYGVKEEIIRNDNSEYYTWQDEEIGVQKEEKSMGGGR